MSKTNKVKVWVIIMGILAIISIVGTMLVWPPKIMITLWIVTLTVFWYTVYKIVRLW